MTGPGGAVVVHALAKINLDLRILGRRHDGYHELRTIFQSIALQDTLICEQRPGPFELRCDAPGIPLDQSNLVWTAAARLWSASGRPGEPIDTLITIAKAIPAQAGLGGGSADAAAAVKGLARLWRIPSTSLAQVAAGIGADVAFFLAGGTALGLGRGDQISPLNDLPTHAVVLAQPAFGVSTAAAYGWYASDREAGVVDHPAGQALPGLWPPGSGQVANDLEPVVIRRHPEIGELVASLREAGAAFAMMSGSGSTVFGLFTSAAAAAASHDELHTRGVATVLTRTLSRAEYERRARPVARRP